MMEIDTGMRFADLRTMLYVGLKWEDKELTLDQTGDIMDAFIEKHTFEELSSKLGEAVRKAFGGKAQPPSKK
jgi:imidazoleglycerol phosphate dehydratase HisB